jgi:hypothetical protein
LLLVGIAGTIEPASSGSMFGGDDHLRSAVL